jgi:hypothetical protein
MMIPGNVVKFANEIVRSGLRQGKIGSSVSRRGSYDDAILKHNYAVAFGGAPSFAGVPCYFASYMYSVGLPSDWATTGLNYDTTFTDDYDSGGMDWPSRQNVFEDPVIPVIAWTDCLLQVTPYAAIGLCARLLQCLPTECAYTDLLAPAALTPGCVALSNWTSCSCFIAGLPDFAWQAIPDKLNADEEIMIKLRAYLQNGNHILTAGLDKYGWMIDFGGAGVPGAFHNPAYLKSEPTTKYAKTWCVTTYTIKECWTLYIGEDMETPARILAPVGSIIFALIFLGLDLLTFMTLFMMAGSGAKVGPAK